jgi:hypothetical protein
MPFMKLTILNRSAVIANLNRWNRRAHDEIKQLVRVWGDRTRTEVSARSPVRTGFMRDHVTLRFGKQGYSWECGWLESDFTGAGFALYPFFLEYGTRYMAPQPTLGPVYAEIAPAYTAALRALLVDLAENPR